MGRSKAECGTESAYRRHNRAKEPVDEACRLAHNEYCRERRKKYLSERSSVSDKPVGGVTAPAREARATRTEAAKAEKAPDYDKNWHVNVLRETLAGLTDAYSRVLESAPDKASPLTKEIRALTAEIERLTAPVEDKPADRGGSALDKFLPGNVARFPEPKIS